MSETFWKISKSTFWSMLFKTALLAMPVVCGGAAAAIKWTYNNVDTLDKRVSHIEDTRLTAQESKQLVKDISTLQADVTIIKQLLLKQNSNNNQRGN